MEGCNSRQIPRVRNCFLSISCNLISFYLISLRRMKNLLLIVLICISSLANAQTNRQRLDDIEFELQKLKIERDGREFDRQMNEQRRLLEKNRDSPFIILDGKVIDVDKHIENRIRNQYRNDWCALTWTGKRFTKDDSNKDNFSSVRFRGIMPLELFFQNKSYDEIQKILQSSSNQKEMIKLCPILKDYNNYIEFYSSRKKWDFR